MDTEDLKKKADSILKEARLTFQKLGRSARSFEKSFLSRYINIIREEVVKDIENIERKAMIQEKETETNIRNFPRFFGEEIWVRSWQVGEQSEEKYAFSVIDMPKDVAEVNAIDKKMKHIKSEYSIPQSKQYTLLSEFKKRIKKLKSQILEGELDDILKMESSKIVYILLKRDSKLWERMQEKSNTQNVIQT